jgi:flagellar FliL protein
VLAPAPAPAGSREEDDTMAVRRFARVCRALGLGLAAVGIPVVVAGSALAASEDGAGEGTPARANYLKLHPDFIVNLHATGPETRFLLATIEVMSRNPGTVEAASAHLPALRHRLLMLLGEQQYPGIEKPDARRALRELALREVNEVIQAELGEDHALEGLFFSNFIVE